MENNKWEASRKLTKADGTIAYVWGNRLHSWEGPALITPKGKKEYYIHGIQYTEENYKEALRNRTGIPPMKDPRFKTRL
jgi:hypothetical protein